LQLNGLSVHHRNLRPKLVHNPVLLRMALHSLLPYEGGVQQQPRLEAATRAPSEETAAQNTSGLTALSHGAMAAVIK
jgi:hypothetical protein